MQKLFLYACTDTLLLYLYYVVIYTELWDNLLIQIAAATSCSTLHYNLEDLQQDFHIFSKIIVLCEGRVKVGRWLGPFVGKFVSNLRDEGSTLSHWGMLKCP